MSQGKSSKGKLIVVALVFAMLAASSLACGGSDNVDAATVEPTPDPIQVKYNAMKNAHALGETLFLYDADQDKRHGLFYGQESIIYIKERNLRGVVLTSNECLNLDIKEECGEPGSGEWCHEYSLQNVGPGDYVYYQDGLWRVTQYTP